MDQEQQQQQQRTRPARQGRKGPSMVSRAMAATLGLLSSTSSSSSSLPLAHASRQLLAPHSQQSQQALSSSSSFTEERSLLDNADNYCGTTWPDAAEVCGLPCPGGTDEECSPATAGELGSDGYKCFFYTGCSQKVDVGTTNNNNSGNSNGSGNTNDNSDSSGSVTSNNQCGTSWLSAMLSCNTPCPTGTECSSGDTCFAATNCDKPLEQLLSDLLVTMLGPDSPMDGTDGAIFGTTMEDILAEVASKEGIALGEVGLGEQSAYGTRRLEERVEERERAGFYERYPNLGEYWEHQRRLGSVATIGNSIDTTLGTMRISNMTQRMLPSGSSALDVSIVITGDYRPPPYLDLNVIAEDSINRQGEKVVSTLRERGSRAGRQFFDRVDGIEAVAKAVATPRPTRTPTGTPTRKPSGPPTATPSEQPSLAPSDEPSSMPSRSLDQVIMTGSSNDLQLGGTTTSSYGYLFNVRTTKGSPVVSITGIEFYTESSADVNYELWTRLGSFKDFKGTYEGWDLIAQGTVTGRGIGRYTAIPDETFKAVHVPGGGEEKGTRAFYITLDKKELVYKLGSGTDSDLLMHDSTADLEIYEGEGVLGYPFPDISEYYYYRYPRQYLGAIHYDRLPCKPYSAFGDVFDLPCPDMPTQSPTLPQPTRSPVTEPPTMLPVTEEPTTPAPIVGYTLPPQVPTGNPTLSPTVSMMPSSSPTSAEPTGSPIVPMRANVISVFRNAPDRLMTEREVEKFLEITTEFLIRKTQKSMVIEGIEVWHHKKTLAAGEVGVMSVNCASGCEEVAVEEEEKEGKEGEAAEAAASTEEGAEEESATDETASEEEEEDKSSSSETPVAESRNTRERTLQKNKLKNREPIIPQVFAMEITLILKISVSTLPLNLLGNMAAVAIDENQEELLALLNEQSAFYTYFKHMDQIQSMSIEDLTKPPTLAPTTYAYWLANQDNDELEETALEEPEVNTFMIGVGLSVGAIWCCLTAITLTFLYKARSAMNEDKDMEDLLRQEKANPLEAKGSVGENTDESDGEANPMEGDEEDPKMDDGDASVNSHLTDSVGDVDEWEDNNKRRGSVSSKLRASTVSKASLKSSMSKPMSRINSFRSSGTSSVGMRKSMTGSVGMRKSMTGSVGMRKSMTGSVGMHKSGNRKSVTSKAARSMSLAPQKNSIQLDEDYKPPRRVSSQPEFKGDFRSSVKGPRNSFAPQNRVAGRKTRTQSVIVKSGAAPAAQLRRSSDFGEEPNKTRRLDGRQSIIKKTID